MQHEKDRAAVFSAKPILYLFPAKNVQTIYGYKSGRKIHDIAIWCLLFGFILDGN